jgi:carboxy-cis,cis-muconate cyclase
LAAKANDADTRTRAIFLLAAKKPPYHVYCNPFYEHAENGTVFAVSEDGALKDHIQDYDYGPGSAIHGMVFDPSESYLYSADMWGNKVWCHKKDPQTGILETVGSVKAPKEHDQPRWVALHPSGKYLYALMEHGNTLAEYEIDTQTHMPVCTNKIYPLVPECTSFSALFLRLDTTNRRIVTLKNNPKMYRADVCALTHSSKYLFATSRSNKAGVPGYISAFRLGPEGAIEKQLSLDETSTSGGHSNAVSPCPWGDEWIALTDDEVGFLEIYRWKDEKLEKVARCEVKEPGFGMNAIWYD